MNSRRSYPLSRVQRNDLEGGHFGTSSHQLLQDELVTKVQSAKRAGGRLQLNMHTPYVCGFA